MKLSIPSLFCIATISTAFLLSFASGETPNNPADAVNAAQFARVVSSDPARTSGTKASRIEEFPAEDLRLTREVPLADGGYRVPVGKNGIGCLGLEWHEFRYFRQVGLQWAKTSARPDSIELQRWTGASYWQGKWMKADAELEKDGNRWTWRLDDRMKKTATDKFRWIFHGGDGPLIVESFSAASDTSYRNVKLRLEAEKPGKDKPVEIEIYNGEFVPSTRERSVITAVWDTSKPREIEVCHAVPGRCKADRTTLRLKMAGREFAVAVEDVINSEAVYVPSAGFFITRSSLSITLADYKKKIAGLKTIRERVEEMPEQSFERALREGHDPFQNRGPMMLSLASDQRKFVAYRHGPVGFTTNTEPSAKFDGKTHRADRRFPHQLHVIFGDNRYEKLSRRLDGDWLPMPETAVDEEGVVYRVRTFVAPVDETPPAGAPDWLRRRAVCAVEYTIENTLSAEAEALMILSVFDNAKKKSRMALRDVDDGIIAEEKDGRLLVFVDTAGAKPLEVKNDSQKTIVHGTLPAGAKVSCTAYIPAWNVKAADFAEFRGTAPRLAERTKIYWKKIIGGGARIELPDGLLTDVIRASRVHIMLAAGNEENGSRIDAWTSADRYGALESESQPVLRGMDMMGHEDFARRGMDFFVVRYNPAGYLTTGYTLMGSGQHLWTLAEFVERSGDWKWFENIAPKVAKMCRWIVAQREKSKILDARGEKTPNYGLLPPGVVADWGRFTNMAQQESHYWAGLAAGARLLRHIGHPDATRLADEVEEYRKDILRAYRWTQARAPVKPLSNGTWVPAQPPMFKVFGDPGDFYTGEDGKRAWCKNGGAHHLMANGVIDPKADDTTRMIDLMEDNDYLHDGLWDHGHYSAERNRQFWFDLGGFSKCQPYYRRTVELYASRDDIKPFIRGYFNMIASSLSLENLSFWEHFHNAGGWNKTHETGWFLCQTRIMLIQERGDELWLAPFVTRNWLKQGMAVSAKHLPTRFGRVGYEIKSSVHEGFIQATVDPPVNEPPKRIVLRLRHPQSKPIKSVTVNGRSHDNFDPKAETISFASDAGTMKIHVEYSY